MIVYKIRHKVTGLFSKGGSTPHWSKTGKTWNRPCDLSNHFSVIEEYREYQKRAWNGAKADPWPYEDAEIVISEISETSATLDIQQWREQTRESRENRRAKLRARREAAIEQHLADLRRKKYEELKKEFG